jgi:hypothetical protein
MNILKSEEFFNARKLTLFVNSNKIPRENILIITTTQNSVSEWYTIFYYGDSEVKEEVPGFFD